MKVPAFIHLFASVYAATRCSVDFYAYEVVRRLQPQLYDRVMQDPANELRRIPIPRTSVNKGKRKVPVIGWGDHDNCRGRFPLPCAERLDPRVVLPLGRSVVGHPKPHAHKSYVAQGLGIHSHIHIRPHRFSDRGHGCLVYR
jgi:hypothetical protein